MARNTNHPNDLRDDGRNAQQAAGALDDAGAPPPFAFSALGPDPSLGWSGWGAGPVAPWPVTPAELRPGAAGKGEQDRPRREPRQR